MAVYTEVSPELAQALLHTLDLGELQQLQGCAQGIENTNYFVTSTCDGQVQEWVLTVFERLQFEQLPFYLNLMTHLAQRGLPVPNPVALPDGSTWLSVQAKPAVLVNRLRGQSLSQPSPGQCAALGQMLARLHLAGRDYAGRQPHLRGLSWWNDVAPQVRTHLNAEQLSLLQSELAYQNHIAATAAYAALPRGAIHADLFRDNVLFSGDAVSGLFDFYFAGVDSWLFDLAVCLNDWCMEPLSAQPLPEHYRQLLGGYHRVRPLCAAERQLLAAMLRAAALRFWLSRLWDYYLPRDAHLLKPHDPTHFERVLQERVHRPGNLNP